MSVQCMELTNLPMNKTQAEEKVAKLKAKLEGKTFMNLRFCCYPIGGSFNVAVRGDAETKEELSEMVISLLTELAM